MQTAACPAEVVVCMRNPAAGLPGKGTEVKRNLPSSSTCLVRGKIVVVPLELFKNVKFPFSFLKYVMSSLEKYEEIGQQQNY